MSVLLSLLLLLAPAVGALSERPGGQRPPLQGVKPESGRFTIFQDGKKIGTEDFSITLRNGGYLAQGRTQISMGNHTFDLRSRMELNEGLKPTSYEYESKGNVIRLKIENPVSELEYIVDGRSEPHDVRFPSDGVIIDDNFFHHYLILLYRAGISGASFPTFVPQQLTIGNLNVRAMGNRTYEIESADMKLTATTDADGRLIRLARPDSKVVVER